MFGYKVYSSMHVCISYYKSDVVPCYWKEKGLGFAVLQLIYKYYGSKYNNTLEPYMILILLAHAHLISIGANPTIFDTNICY